MTKEEELESLWRHDRAEKKRLAENPGLVTGAEMHPVVIEELATSTWQIPAPGSEVLRDSQSTWKEIVGDHMARFSPGSEEMTHLMAVGCPPPEMLESFAPAAYRKETEWTDEGTTQYVNEFVEMVTALKTLREHLAEMPPLEDPMHYDEAQCRIVESAILESLERKGCRSQAILTTHCVPQKLFAGRSIQTSLTEAVSAKLRAAGAIGKTYKFAFIGMRSSPDPGLLRMLAELVKSANRAKEALDVPTRQEAATIKGLRFGHRGDPNVHKENLNPWKSHRL